MGNSSKLPVLAYFGQFSMQLVTDFGSRCDPDVFETSGSGYRELVKTRTFVLFWLVLHAIAHSFWIPLRFERFGNRGVRLRELIKTRSFGLFRPVMYAITH